MQQQHGSLKGSRMSQSSIPTRLMMMMKGMHRHTTRHLKRGHGSENVQMSVSGGAGFQGLTKAVSRGIPAA